MHFEQSAILTVHNHVITRNPRISVAHDKHRTWFLHINNVQEEDKGRYMCQINTVTAKTQYGYLHVVGKYKQEIPIARTSHTRDNIEIPHIFLQSTSEYKMKRQVSSFLPCMR